MKFKIGDKIAAYEGAYRHVGLVVEIKGGQWPLLIVKAINDSIGVPYSPKQCRLIKPKLNKIKRTGWINCYENGPDILHESIKKADYIAWMTGAKRLDCVQVEYEFKGEK